MITSELLKTKYTGSDENGNLLLAYTSEQVGVIKQSLTEYNELKAKVKRYFEIKHRGILNIDDSNEHIKLLDEIIELVGITTFDKDDDLNKQEI